MFYIIRLLLIVKLCRSSTLNLISSICLRVSYFPESNRVGSKVVVGVGWLIWRLSLKAINICQVFVGVTGHLNGSTFVLRGWSLRNWSSWVAIILWSNCTVSILIKCHLLLRYLLKVDRMGEICQRLAALISCWNRCAFECLIAYF